MRLLLPHSVCLHLYVFGLNIFSENKVILTSSLYVHKYCTKYKDILYIQYEKHVFSQTPIQPIIGHYFYTFEFE